MFDSAYTVAVIAIVAAVTWLVRGLPYLMFGGKKQIPPIITYLGIVLPASIMIILVLYCLRNTPLTTYPYGLVELVSVSVVVALHLWKRNTIISITAGTLSYMVLLRIF